jgi:ABC-type phosphate/phosphonate transport system substrate-binding protein
MSRRDGRVLIGCVAYHPRIVTIWEGFLPYFADRGQPTDYVLYSNYERQVEALLAGEIDIGWNTNTAYVAAEARIGGDAQVLGMRDVDADFRTVLVRRRDDALEGVRALAGRRLALGSRDSGHAAILPLYYLAREGLDAAAECELVRFDTDLGKHGDTGDSELRVLHALREGEADAGAVGDATWALLRTQSPEHTDGLEVWWRSPTYYHCNFTALPSFEGAAEWSEVLLAMSYDDPSVRVEMELEGVKRWLPGDKSGYADLTEAMRRQGYIG